jgi:hypothetical protein
MFAHGKCDCVVVLNQAKSVLNDRNYHDWIRENCFQNNGAYLYHSRCIQKVFEKGTLLP